MNKFEYYKNLNIEELVDIRTVKINVNDSKEEKIRKYKKQIKNPYCYRYKDYKVIIEFDENSNANLNQKITEYINL